VPVPISAVKIFMAKFHHKENRKNNSAFHKKYPLKYAKIGVMNKNFDSSKETVTYRAHKRNYMWQILMPILVASALVLFVAIAIATGTANSVSVWADISVIWIIIPLLIFALIILVLLVTLIYGMARLIDITPFYTQKATTQSRLMKEKVRGLADSSTKPVFIVEGFSAKISSIFKRKQES